MNADVTTLRKQYLSLLEQAMLADVVADAQQLKEELIDVMKVGGTDPGKATPEIWVEYAEMVVNAQIAEKNLPKAPFCAGCEGCDGEGSEAVGPHWPCETLPSSQEV